MIDIIAWILLIPCVGLGIFLFLAVREEKRMWKEFFGEIRKHRKKTVRVVRND